MSKAKDRYYEFKVIADAHFGGLSDDVTGYVEELEAYQAYTGDLIRCYEDQRIKLEAENQTLKLEQKQCLLCTARHKEELSEVKQQKAELIEFVEEVVFSLESYLTGKDWNRLEKAGLKLIEKNWVKS